MRRQGAEPALGDQLKNPWQPGMTRTRTPIARSGCTLRQRQRQATRTDSLCLCGRSALVILPITFGLGCLSVVQAQETIRMSLASAQAAEARRQAAASVGYYNLKLGPTGWRFASSLGVEYNDNVRLVEEGKEGDFIFRPAVSTQMLWPVTDKNTLNLTMGVGYSAYVRNLDLSRLYIAPGSELSFDLYVGDVWVNLHDRFYITENSYQDPTVTGTGNYSRLENVAGATATWDLNKAIVRAGFDHVNYLALSGASGQPDGQSELVWASLGYALKPGMITGVELGGGLLNYRGTNVLYPNAKQWNAGVFFESQVSEYIHLRVSGGHTDYAPEGGAATNEVSDFTGLYGQLEIQHRVNEFLDYTLSAGRSISFAFYGGSVDLIYARLMANWNILRKVSLGTTLQYEHGNELTGVREIFDRYGASIHLARTLTAKLSAGLGYEFWWRTSDVAGRDYTVNVVSMNLSSGF